MSTAQANSDFDNGTSVNKTSALPQQQQKHLHLTMASNMTHIDKKNINSSNSDKYCEDNDEILAHQNQMNHMRQAAAIAAANRQQQLVKQQNSKIQQPLHKKLTLSPVPPNDFNSSHSDDSGVHSPNQIRAPNAQKPYNGASMALKQQQNQITFSTTISQQHRLLQQQHQQHQHQHRQQNQPSQQNQQNQQKEFKLSNGDLKQQSHARPKSIIMPTSSQPQLLGTQSNTSEQPPVRLSATERLALTAKRPLTKTSTANPQTITTTSNRTTPDMQQQPVSRIEPVNHHHQLKLTKSASVLPTLKTLLQQQQKLKQQKDTALESCNHHSLNKQQLSNNQSHISPSPEYERDNLSSYDRVLPETPPGGSSEDSDESSPMSSLQSCESPPPPILMPPPPPSLLKPEHQQSLNDLRSVNNSVSAANTTFGPSPLTVSQAILVTAHPAVASPDGVPDLRSLGVGVHHQFAKSYYRQSDSKIDLVQSSSKFHHDNGDHHSHSIIHTQSNDSTIARGDAQVSQEHTVFKQYTVDAQNDLHNNNNNNDNNNHDDNAASDDDKHAYPLPPPPLSSDIDTCQDHQTAPKTTHKAMNHQTSNNQVCNHQVGQSNEMACSDTIKNVYHQSDRVTFVGSTDNSKTTKLINSLKQQQQQQQLSKQFNTIESSPSQQQQIITGQKQQQQQCQPQSISFNSTTINAKQQHNNNSQLLAQQHLNESDMQMKLSTHQAHHSSFNVNQNNSASSAVSKRQQLFAAPADFRTSGPVTNLPIIKNATADNVNRGFVHSQILLPSCSAVQKASNRADVSPFIMTNSLQTNSTRQDEQSKLTFQQQQQRIHQKHLQVNQTSNFQNQVSQHNNLINNKLPPAANQPTENQQVPSRMSARDRLSISSTASAVHSISSLDITKCAQQSVGKQTSIVSKANLDRNATDISKYIGSLKAPISNMHQQQQQKHLLMTTSYSSDRSMTTTAIQQHHLSASSKIETCTSSSGMLTNVTSKTDSHSEINHKVSNDRQRSLADGQHQNQPMTSSLIFQAGVIFDGNNDPCFADQHNMSRKTAAATNLQQCQIIKQNDYQQERMTHSSLSSDTPSVNKYQTTNVNCSNSNAGSTGIERMVNTDSRSYPLGHALASCQSEDATSGSEFKQSSNSNLHLIRPPPQPPSHQQQPLLNNTLSPILLTAAAATAMNKIEPSTYNYNGGQPQERHYQADKSLEQINALSSLPQLPHQSYPGGQHSKMHMTAKTEQLYKQHKEQQQQSQNGHSVMLTSTLTTKPIAQVAKGGNGAVTDISAMSCRAEHHIGQHQQQVNGTSPSSLYVDEPPKPRNVVGSDRRKPNRIQSHPTITMTTMTTTATMTDIGNGRNNLTSKQTTMADNALTTNVQYKAGQLHDVIDKRHHDETNQLASSNGNFLSQIQQNHHPSKMQQQQQQQQQQKQHPNITKFAPISNTSYSSATNNISNKTNHASNVTSFSSLDSTKLNMTTSNSNVGMQTIKDEGLGFVQNSTRLQMPSQINHHSVQPKSCVDSSSSSNQNNNNNHHHQHVQTASIQEPKSIDRSSLPPPPPLPEKRTVLKRPTNKDLDTMPTPPPLLPPHLPHKHQFTTYDTMDNVDDLVDHHLHLNKCNMNQYINIDEKQFNQRPKRDYTGSTMIDQQQQQQHHLHIVNTNNNKCDHMANYDDTETDFTIGFTSIQSNASDESFRFPTPPPPLPPMINHTPILMTSSSMVNPDANQPTSSTITNHKLTTTNCEGTINSNQFSRCESGNHEVNHGKGMSCPAPASSKMNQINHLKTQVTTDINNQKQQQPIGSQSSNQHQQPMMNAVGDYSVHLKQQSYNNRCSQTQPNQATVYSGQSAISKNDQLAHHQRQRSTLGSNGQQYNLEQVGMLSSSQSSNSSQQPPSSSTIQLQLQKQPQPHQSKGDHLSPDSNTGQSASAVTNEFIHNDLPVSNPVPVIVIDNDRPASNINCNQLSQASIAASCQQSGMDIPDFVASGSTRASTTSHLNHIPIRQQHHQSYAPGSHQYSPPPPPLPPGSSSPSSSSDGGISSTGSSSSTSGVHSASEESQLKSIHYRKIAAQMPTLKMLQKHGLCAEDKQADTNSVSSVSSEQSLQSNSSRDERAKNSMEEQRYNQSQQATVYTKSEFRAKHHYHSDDHSNSINKGDNDQDELGVDENADMSLDELDEAMMIKAMMRMLSNKMLSRQQQLQKKQQVLRKSLLNDQDMSKLRQKVKQMQQKQHQHNNNNNNDNNSLLSPALINKLKLMINGEDLEGCDDDFEEDDDDEESTSATLDTEESEDSTTAGHNGKRKNVVGQQQFSSNNRLMSRANIDKRLVSNNNNNNNNGPNAMYYQHAVAPTSKVPNANCKNTNETIKAKSIISSNESKLSSIGNKKKSVSFSDKIELVACADEQVEEFLPNPLLDRILKQAKSQQQQQQQKPT